MKALELESKTAFLIIWTSPLLQSLEMVSEVSTYSHVLMSRVSAIG
jgi:hypothetical protein